VGLLFFIVEAVAEVNGLAGQGAREEVALVAWAVLMQTDLLQREMVLEEVGREIITVHRESGVTAAEES
jgi:hypothetical protein